MSESAMVPSRGLDGTFDDPQMPRAEVRNRRLNHINLNWI
jgi:hypothetical protein